MEAAKSILQTMNYGHDGYFFVYDLAGNNLVHPRQPELVGRNLWDLTDPQGRRVIQSLLDAAKQGDGYQRYAWEKPSTHKMTEKLGYVVILERWGWMLGTGIYLDDVEHTLRTVHDHAANALQKLAGLALAAILVVSIFGLAASMKEHRLSEISLKSIAQRIVTTQEEERTRVARELHDGISQVLVSTKFQFELVRHKLEKREDHVTEELNKGIVGLSQAIGEVRRISHDLHPSILDTVGLSAAILQLTAEFERRTGIHVSNPNVVDGLVLSEREALAFFRTAQEALTNIERHAAATTATLSLVREPPLIRLIITDNGHGFDVNKIDRERGIGLRNIRGRIEHLGGQFELSSQSGCTRLAVGLPNTTVKV
jgi:two-component system NarL family sensor kinase